MMGSQKKAERTYDCSYMHSDNLEQKQKINQSNRMVGLKQYLKASKGWPQLPFSVSKKTGSDVTAATSLVSGAGGLGWSVVDNRVV